MGASQPRILQPSGNAVAARAFLLAIHLRSPKGIREFLNYKHDIPPELGEARPELNLIARGLMELRELEVFELGAEKPAYGEGTQIHNPLAPPQGGYHGITREPRAEELGQPAMVQNHAEISRRTVADAKTAAIRALNILSEQGHFEDIASAGLEMASYADSIRGCNNQFLAMAARGVAEQAKQIMSSIGSGNGPQWLVSVSGNRLL